MSNIASDITSDTKVVPQPVDDTTFLKINAEYKLCKVLEREKQLPFKQAHRRFAYGLSGAEFSDIVTKLVSLGFCSTKEGERGGILISLNEHSSSLTREVCKPLVLRVVDNNPALADLLNNTTAAD